MSGVAFHESTQWINIEHVVDFAGNMGSLIKVRPKLRSASTFAV